MRYRVSDEFTDSEVSAIDGRGMRKVAMGERVHTSGSDQYMNIGKQSSAGTGKSRGQEQRDIHMMTSNK